MSAPPFDSGGVLSPGWVRVRNDSGKPERLMPPPEKQAKS